MKKLLILFASLLIVASCAPQATKRDDMSATLRLGWIASGSFAGEVVGQKKFASANGLKLGVRQGGLGLNTISLVATGQDTFGTLAADEVLLANENGADLVIIGVINNTSPGAFVSLRESNITRPSDFEGATVGILPFGSTTLLYEAMLKANNVDHSKIKERIVSPDLRPFLAGEYDVHPVFAYDETITLDQQGIEYNLIEPAHFGVDFKGPVYFTTRKIADERPELVRAFVETMADGWSYALENRDDAIGTLKEFAPEIDEVRELAVLNRGAVYFQGFNNQPINSDYESWRTMMEEMVKLGKLRKMPDMEKTIRLGWIQQHDFEK